MTISYKKLQSYNNRAVVIAAESPDSETKVAALLINKKTGVVITEGYNGFVRGADDSVLPTTRPDKHLYIVHAESNLICNAVRHGITTDEQIVFCSLSPCMNCVRMLWQAGITEIYFRDKYKDFDASASMLDLNIATEAVGDFYLMKLSVKKPVFTRIDGVEL